MSEPGRAVRRKMTVQSPREQETNGRGGPNRGTLGKGTLEPGTGTEQKWIKVRGKASWFGSEDLDLDLV